MQILAEVLEGTRQVLPLSRKSQIGDNTQPIHIILGYPLHGLLSSSQLLLTLHL